MAVVVVAVAADEETGIADDAEVDNDDDINALDGFACASVIAAVMAAANELYE